MAEERVQRRLAAILAADVVGYSRMMRDDETGTLSQLKTLRSEVFDPKVDEYGGRIFKTTGDGVLIEFPSATDAVQHAIDVQQEIAQRNLAVPEKRKIEFRIGINLGDIIVEGDDLFGDGVNIAARLEGLAEPGGICLSGMVHEGVRHKLDVPFIDMGEQSVKNIADPVRVYRIALASANDGSGAVKTASSDALLRRPAVAVLPFDNLSGDPNQEYFADGLTEDIITALSLWRSFPVIARNSSFAYKGTSPDIRKVGEELGARYIVEGSVRKVGNRVRVTAQLINSETGHHVWAERIDRDLSDIFELQDELTRRIATAIEPTIERTEQRRVSAKSPADLAAWEYTLRGYAYIYEETKEANEKAREMFYRAIEVDPQFARAHTGLSYTYVKDLRFFGTDDRDEWVSLCLESARRAITLDEMDSEARTMLARAFNFMAQRDASIAEARHAVDLNPFDPYAKNVLGGMLALGSGRFDEGIPWIEQAIQLSPKDPQLHIIIGALALAYLGVGKYEKAVELSREAVRLRSGYFEAHATLASALGYLGRSQDAQAEIEPFKAVVRDRVEQNALFAQVTKDCILDGLRKSGWKG